MARRSRTLRWVRGAATLAGKPYVDLIARREGSDRPFDRLIVASIDGGPWTVERWWGKRARPREAGDSGIGWGLALHIRIGTRDSEADALALAEQWHADDLRVFAGKR